MTASRKPTVAELGVDLEAQEWRRSSDAPGAIEVAFVQALGEPWALMRIAGDESGRVLVYNRDEWVAFVEGAKDGEFDIAEDEAAG